MYKKPVLIGLYVFLALTVVLQVVNAATMTFCTSDRDAYKQGERYMRAHARVYVTIYNDENAKIRVTQLSATIDYYTTGDARYLQKSFTNTELPDEIPAGESATYQISIDLPRALFLVELVLWF